MDKRLGLFLAGTLLLLGPRAFASWKVLDHYFSGGVEENYAWGLAVARDGTIYTSIQAGRADPPKNGRWVVRRLSPGSSSFETIDDFQLYPGLECRPGEIAVNPREVFVVGQCMTPQGTWSWILRSYGISSRTWQTTLNVANAYGSSVLWTGRRVLAGGTVNTPGGVRVWTVLGFNPAIRQWHTADRFSGEGGFGAVLEKMRLNRSGGWTSFGSERTNSGGWSRAIARARGPDGRWKLERISGPERALVIEDALQTRTGAWLVAGYFQRQSSIGNYGFVSRSVDRGNWKEVQTAPNSPETWSGFQGLLEDNRAKRLLSILEYQDKTYYRLKTFESKDDGRSWSEIDAFLGIEGYGAVPMVLKQGLSGEIFCSGTSGNAHTQEEKPESHGDTAVVLQWEPVSESPPRGTR